MTSGFEQLYNLEREKALELQDEIEALRAENERLRAALEEARDLARTGLGSAAQFMESDYLNRIAYIANAALDRRDD